MLSATLVLLLVSLLTFYLIWKWYIVHRNPEDKLPPGPWLKVPILGQAHWLMRDPIGGLSQLRKKFGDIYTLENGNFRSIYVNELSAIEELYHRDNFAGRLDIDVNIKEDVIKKLRGYYPCPGLVNAYGKTWKEQRRFAMTQLKEFGFGKASLQEVILEEFQDLAVDIQRRCDSGESEIKVNYLFNAITINILWRIVDGKGLDKKDLKQLEVFENVEKFLGSFGVNNFLLSLGLKYIPTFLRAYDPFMNSMKRVFDLLFDTFDKQWEEHEKTYDEANMRDFIDVYIREFKRVDKEGHKDSSFYGKQGKANFRNVMMDLFITGSETTSTSMVFTVLYCIHHPSIVRRLQKEIDNVVGRERLPEASDRENMPYAEAFISEVQRHATLAPFALPHVPLKDDEALGYKFKKNQVVNANLYEVMHDPANFPDPHRFDPDRFLDQETGRYVAPKAYVPFGIGKRECLGKSLAKWELFFLTTALVQRFNIEPASSGVPALNDAKIGVVRYPTNFKARFISRVD